MWKKIKREDITEREFINKTIKFRKIKDEKTTDAAGFAIVEAIHWSESANIICKNNRKLNSQICVNALLSIELFLKSILLNMKINVTEKKFNHNIFEMYEMIDDDLKENIKRNIKIDKEIHLDIFNEVLRLETFEEELKYISNDFMYLRYEYEKFLNCIPIIILTDFIMQLKENTQKIAMNYNYLVNYSKK